MGQEITDSHFSAQDFEQFFQRLRQETRLLGQWLTDGHIPGTGEHVGGLEMEAWLVDRQVRPASVNRELLDRLRDPLVVPELALFNLELNSSPLRLEGASLSRMAEELARTWARCGRAAAGVGARMVMVGILPTVAETDLTSANMSAMQRYRALDDQLSRLRNGAPLLLEIEGRERVSCSHRDVMLESATTSFQIHLKIDPDQAARFYNASKIVSAPMVGVSANSPYLFGADLWDETRIPLFEQSVQVGESDLTKRVSFGIRYARTIFECFEANLIRYPVLLPQVMDEPLEALAHLRLHNGTIWRWNRPLVGFNEAGQPHIRIEHRVVPAGPTVMDSIANMAFYFGMTCALAEQEEPPEQRLPFELARDNFYQAARHSINAEVVWLDGQRGGMRALCREQLLPLAHQGLVSLGIDREEADHWLGFIKGRLATGRNGAGWQRAWVTRHGADMAALTEAYLEHQESGRPVHEWGV
jgi:hypothetical protein